MPAGRLRVSATRRCRSLWSGNTTRSRRSTSSRRAINWSVGSVGRASPFDVRQVALRPDLALPRELLERQPGLFAQHANTRAHGFREGIGLVPARHRALTLGRRPTTLVRRGRTQLGFREEDAMRASDESIPTRVRIWNRGEASERSHPSPAAHRPTTPPATPGGQHRRTPRANRIGQSLRAEGARR